MVKRLGFQLVSKTPLFGTVEKVVNLGVSKTTLFETEKFKINSI
jgi:hypothetical protein